MYFLNCFLIYSIFGYIYETLLGIITKTNYKSGILHGPWAVIYGIGVVVILLLSNYFFKNLHMPRLLETIIVFFILAIFYWVLSFFAHCINESINQPIKEMQETIQNYTNSVTKPVNTGSDENEE